MEEIDKVIGEKDSKWLKENDFLISAENHLYYQWFHNGPYDITILLYKENYKWRCFLKEDGGRESRTIKGAIKSLIKLKEAEVFALKDFL